MKLLEICCVSVEDCIHAQEGGADRIELCASMAAGGLTPSYATFKLAKEACSIPIVVMVRPRNGGFCYNELEFKVMMEDTNQFLKMGADGIVFGCLNENREVNLEQTKQLCDLIGEKEAIFHLAFEQCDNPFTTIDQLAECGIDRVLTGGKAGNAEKGIESIRSLVEEKGSKMQILCAGGIRSHNVEAILNSTHAQQVHSACRHFIQDKSDPVIEGVLDFNNAYDAVSLESVIALKSAMKKLSKY